MAIVACCHCPLELKSSQFLPQFHSLLPKLQWQHIGWSNNRRSRINALFWGPKKTVDPPDNTLTLGNFTLTGSGSEEAAANASSHKKISVLVISSISEVLPQEWDACALDASGAEKFNPFLTHGFLSSLEESRSSVKETGWMPRHLIAKDEVNNVIGVVPLYLKSHSYGEYVFDHAWADAYYSYGSRYYPKLQSCVPFTPVTGPRILLRDTTYKDEVFDLLVTALKDLTHKLNRKARMLIDQINKCLKN